MIKNKLIKKKTESQPGHDKCSEFDIRKSPAGTPDLPIGQFFTVYVALPGYRDLLLKQLSNVKDVHGDLIVCSEASAEVYWISNIWFKASYTEISSITAASRYLKAIQRNWYGYFYKHFRRGELIQSQLPKISCGPKNFPSASLPRGPLGSYTLVEPNILLAAADCQSAYPNGQLSFVEDRKGPPSRAYLKLWEALTLYGELPKQAETCLELGAAPGGWTYVMAQFGTSITAVDRAPLRNDIATRTNVKPIQADAFTFLPEQVGPVDWLISDVICYPDRLYDFVKRWIEAGTVRHIICTIKFQGTSHYQVISQFAKLPGGWLRHLSYNKHELTFFYKRQCDIANEC